MLAAKRSADVAPEVNLRMSLCTGEEACKLNPEDTSPELQNRGISGLTKRTDVLQFFLTSDLGTHLLTQTDFNVVQQITTILLLLTVNGP